MTVAQPVMLASARLSGLNIQVCIQHSRYADLKVIIFIEIVILSIYRQFRVKIASFDCMLLGDRIRTRSHPP